MLKAPVPYSSDVETIGPDEQEPIDKLNDTARYIVEQTDEDLGHAQRGVHAKNHALLATASPTRRRRASSSAGAAIPSSSHMSAIPGDPIRDSVSLPRGFSITIIGIDGARLPGSEDEVMQDVLMASGPAPSDATPDGFLRNTQTLVAITDRAK